MNPNPIFSIKRNDTLPTFTIYVTDENGDALDLTDGVSARVFMYTDADPRVEKIDATAGFVSPRTTGGIEYGWNLADTDEAGEYLAEVEIVFADGGILTFPTEGFVRVHIWEDLSE